MLSKTARSVFDFCTRWNFPLAKIAVDRKNCMSRLCYVSTQKYRMYLSLSRKGLEYIPCIKEEHQWRPVDVLRRVPKPDAAELFRDVITMEQKMTLHFFMQFPEAEVSFFDNLPTAEEVQHAIANKPFGDVLMQNFYMFHRDEDKAVEGADGVVVILVDEGRLMLPYTYENGRNHDYNLQLYRAKLHPDSYVSYYGNKFWRVVDNVVSSMHDISWGNFRRLINQFVR